MWVGRVWGVCAVCVCVWGVCVCVCAVCVCVCVGVGVGAGGRYQSSHMYVLYVEDYAGRKDNFELVVNSNSDT